MSSKPDTRLREATERLLAAIARGEVSPKAIELAALASRCRKKGLHALAIQVADRIPSARQV
jgi:hypothetical protein